MNCPEAEQFFDAYLDGELAGSLRLEFDAHRLRCSACQQKLAMMEACEHILARDSRTPTLSDDFTNRVMSEIEQRRLVARRTRNRRITIAATVALQAAAVVIFAVVWSGYWKVKPTAGPTSEVIDWDKLRAERDRAFSENNPGMLQDAIMSRVLAAPSNLENEVSGLSRYAGSLFIDGLTDALSSLSSAPPSLGELINIVPPSTPEPAEEIEPSPRTRGPIEL
jgi:hypothetical protein